jgi:hypothetical protein
VNGRLYGRRLPVGSLPEQVHDLPELVGIFELPVHRCEAYIRNGVDGFKPFHHHLADFAGVHLFFEAIVKSALNILSGFVEQGACDVFAASTRKLHAVNYLASIEGFTAVIRFDNEELKLFNIFDRCEAATAPFTLSSPLNGGTIVKGSGLQDMVLILSTAKRTLHGYFKPSQQLI